MILAWAACTGPEPEDTGVTTDTTFEVIADQLASGTLLGAWSDGDELVFVGGTLAFDGPTTGGIARWDGTSMCTQPDVASATLWWIHGAAPGDWYAVGAEGTVLHSVDGVISDESLPTPATLYGVWAAEDGRVWAVGGDVQLPDSGEIWLREGGVWAPFATGLSGTVFKVWDRWFVGVGMSWHLDGDTLTEVPIPEGERLLTVRGRADDDVWAVGGATGALLLHWAGSAWEEVDVDPHCSAQPLNGVWTGPGEDVWIAGNSGSMGRFDGTSWECSFPPITGEHFHATWRHAGAQFWAGGNLFATGDNYGTVAHYGDASIGTVSVATCPQGVR
jgi:hypothetical protein